MIELDPLERLMPVPPGFLLLLGLLLLVAACTAESEPTPTPGSTTPSPEPAVTPSPIPTQGAETDALAGQFQLRTVFFVQRLISFPQPGVQCETLRTVWMEAPKKWRLEPERIQGEPTDCGAVYFSVSDGVSHWVYDAEGAFARRSGRPSHILTVGSFFQQDAVDGLDVDEVGAETRSDAYVRRFVGMETVAGRQAYVIEWQPTARRRSTTNPDRDEGIRRIWIDNESFLVLKSEQYDYDGGLLSSSVVERVEYDGDIPPDVFTFTPPPGTTVAD